MPVKGKVPRLSVSVSVSSMHFWTLQNWASVSLMNRSRNNPGLARISCLLCLSINTTLSCPDCSTTNVGLSVAVGSEVVGAAATVFALAVAADGNGIGFVRNVMDFGADCGESHATKSNRPDARPVICVSNFRMKYISIVFQFQPAFIFYNKVKPEYLIKCHGIVKFCKSFVKD